MVGDTLLISDGDGLCCPWRESQLLILVAHHIGGTLEEAERIVSIYSVDDFLLSFAQTIQATAALKASSPLPRLAIVNTASIDEPGEHWISIAYSATGPCPDTPLGIGKCI